MIYLLQHFLFIYLRPSDFSAISINGLIYIKDDLALIF